MRPAAAGSRLRECGSHSGQGVLLHGLLQPNVRRAAFLGRVDIHLAKGLGREIDRMLQAVHRQNHA